MNSVSFCYLMKLLERQRNTSFFAIKQGDMKGRLERAVELLRPLVDSKTWDCCVVWRLGDDPSRFIQWIGCCCSAGDGGSGGKVKEERGEEASLCRDLKFKHPIRSKACEALACFPAFIPLYSGIHGEVVLSNQSKWIHVSGSDSTSSPGSIGTRVLIPVFGGLIELFAGKHIPKNQKIIEFITSQFNGPKQESMTVHDYSSSLSELSLEHNMQNLPMPYQVLNLIPQAQVLQPLNETVTHSGFEVSSTCSTLSNEQLSLDSNSNLCEAGLLKQSFGKPSPNKKSKCQQSNLLKKQTGQFPDSDNKVAKVNQRSERNHFRSKNLVTERKRRSRIQSGLLALRALVPKITKMDKASILGDAINYVSELEEEKKKLEDELNEIEEEETKLSTEVELPKALVDRSKNQQSKEEKQDSSGLGENVKIELQLEINQIGKREFLIRVLYEKQRGGFGRLMDAICSLGLQVVDANMTTFSGKVLNILRVESDAKEVQLKKLKESLQKFRG